MTEKLKSSQMDFKIHISIIMTKIVFFFWYLHLEPARWNSVTGMSTKTPTRATGTSCKSRPWALKRAPSIPSVGATLSWYLRTDNSEVSSLHVFLMLFPWISVISVDGSVVAK